MHRLENGYSIYSTTGVWGVGHDRIKNKVSVGHQDQTDKIQYLTNKFILLMKANHIESKEAVALFNKRSAAILRSL
jgi:hypothetical protein